MTEVSLSDWQRFVELHPTLHVLQTAAWGELKAAFGWKAVRLICDDLGVQILFRHLPLGLNVAYIPKAVLGDQQSSAKLWEEVTDVCRRQRAIFLKVEPDAWEVDGQPVRLPRGFRRSVYNIQPPRTIVVGLGGSEDDILGRMKQKCRYNIRLAEKKGVTVRPWSDLKGFHELLQTTGDRDAFGVHSLDYYQRAYDLFRPTGNCELLAAEYEGQPVAALMVFKQGERSWYLYGASSDLERNRMPTYLLQWEAMRWAKERGCKEYDLWGVPDENESKLEADFENRHDGLWGVYRFKRGFGGELRRAQQAIDEVFNPVLYRLYEWRMAGREAG